MTPGLAMLLAGLVLGPASTPQRPPVAAPIDAPETHAPLVVAVISDLNSRYGSTTYTSAVHGATRALVDRIHPDLVLITGDMVAGQKGGLDHPAMWRAFHGAVTEPLVAAGVAVAPAPGNHDAAPGFANERAEYIAQWTDEHRVPPVDFIDRSAYPLHYSFSLRGVFFAAIDATAVGPLSATQRDWLDTQLAQTDSDVKIVFGHLPNHPFAKQREVEILDDPKLEDIMRRHEVDAYVSGHHHAYYPGAVGRVRHVAMPCLGSGARRLLGHTKASPPALVVLQIDAERVVSVEALPAPAFETPVPRGTLPRKITRGRHDVLRDDLAGL
jgi:3',5'-cyclic AMP phosphodiesterase CpdA